MKNLAAPEIDRYRVVHPLVGREPDELRAWGGCFDIPFRNSGRSCAVAVRLRVIASRGGCPFGADRLEHNQWDHVSVSTSDRRPTWEELEFVKRLFFERHECAMQLHVPARDHVNNHEFCLHIWRPLDREIPRPPADMVGIPGVTGMAAGVAMLGRRPCSVEGRRS